MGQQSYQNCKAVGFNLTLNKIKTIDNANNLINFAGILTSRKANSTTIKIVLECFK